MKLATVIGEYPELADLLERAIIDNPPVVIRDGGVIAEGFDEELDELRNISENAGQYLLDVETRERERTGISTLKVGYNRCMVTTSKSAGRSLTRRRWTISAARP